MHRLSGFVSIFVVSYLNGLRSTLHDHREWVLSVNGCCVVVLHCIITKFGYVMHLYVAPISWNFCTLWCTSSVSGAHFGDGKVVLCSCSAIKWQNSRVARAPICGAGVFSTGYSTCDCIANAFRVVEIVFVCVFVWHCHTHVVHGQQILISSAIFLRTAAGGVVRLALCTVTSCAIVRHRHAPPS